jgi:hypothetical protein
MRVKSPEGKRDVTLTALYPRAWVLWDSLKKRETEEYGSGENRAKQSFVRLIYKVKHSSPATRHWGACGERRYSSYSFTTSALDGGEWSASRPGHALPPGKEPPVLIVQEAGWTPESVWTQRLEEKSFASAGDRTPFARLFSSSQTLYWLSTPAPSSRLIYNSRHILTGITWKTKRGKVCNRYRITVTSVKKWWMELCRIQEESGSSSCVSEACSKAPRSYLRRVKVFSRFMRLSFFRQVPRMFPKAGQYHILPINSDHCFLPSF